MRAIMKKNRKSEKKFHADPLVPCHDFAICKSFCDRGINRMHRISGADTVARQGGYNDIKAVHPEWVIRA